MNVYFTSDTHFGHDAILRYCMRPFCDVHAMGEALIANWNAVITKRDIVYHLGDVFFGDPDRALQRLQRLQGKKFLIPGNHDTAKHMEVLSEVFEVLPPLYNCACHQDGTKYRVTLCHYPLLSWDRSHHRAIMLHGHHHGRLPGNGQRLDVGVDCWSFSPVRFDKILHMLSKLPPMEIIEKEGAIMSYLDVS